MRTTLLLLGLAVTAASLRARATEPAAPFGLDGATAGTAAYVAGFTPDSRHLLFLSTANNLVRNDDRGVWMDVFLHDIDAGSNTLVSVNRSGTGGGNGNSLSPSASADGRFVAFLSDASDLATNPAPARVVQVYVRDTQQGVTVLVSATPEGVGGNGGCGAPLISRDGRYVVFESDASDLVPGDANRARDVFARDLTESFVRLVSSAADGSGSGSAASDSPRISADGKTVVFRSAARNLVTAPAAGFAATEVYLRNLSEDSAHLVSTAVLTDAPEDPVTRAAAEAPVLSSSGRYVAYQARSPRFLTHNAVVIQDREQPGRRWIQRWGAGAVKFVSSPMSLSDVGPTLVCDLSINFSILGPLDTLTLRLQPSADGSCSTSQLGGAPVPPGTDRGFLTSVPPVLPGEPEPGCLNLQALGTFSGALVLADSLTSTVSDDGTLVLLRTGSPLPSQGTVSSAPAVGASGIFERPEWARVFEFPSFTQRSLPLDAGHDSAVLSPDGSWIAYDSVRPAAADGDENGDSDVFLVPRSGSPARLVSRRLPEMPSLRGARSPLLASGALDDEGERLVFAALWPWKPDVFPYDPSYRTEFVAGLGALRPAPVGAYPTPTNSQAPVFATRYRTNSIASLGIDGSGSIVADVSDSFFAPFYERLLRVVDLETHQSRVLVRTGSYPFDFPPAPPFWSMSRGGEAIAFDTLDAFPLLGDNDLVQDVYVWRRNDPETLVWVSRPAQDSPPGLRAQSTRPYVSPNARFVIFFSKAADLSSPAQGFVNSRIWVADLERQRTDVLIGSLPSIDIPPLDHEVVWSADSQHCVIRTEDGVVRLFDISTLQGRIISRTLADLHLSADGRYLAAVTPAISADRPGMQVVRMDFQTGESNLVSVAMDRVSPGNGASRHPQISPDGRRVVFSSVASDLVEGDDNGRTDVFVRDMEAGLTALLSRSLVTGRSGNGASSRPYLSGNGLTVVFTSVASDLVPDDFNGEPDLFRVHFDVPDSDGDGLPDSWERRYFGSLSRADAATDSDGDGVPDAVEWLEGTSPVDLHSFQGPGSLSFQPLTGLSVSWSVNPWGKYQLQSTDSLDAPEWVNVGDPVKAVSGVLELSDTLHPPGGRRFYRLLTLW